MPSPRGGHSAAVVQQRSVVALTPTLTLTLILIVTLTLTLTLILTLTLTLTLTWPSAWRQHATYPSPSVATR